MNSEILGFALALLAVVIASRLIAIPHMGRMMRQINEIKRRGAMSSVGVKKDWRGARIYIIVADKEGRIQKGYVLAGITVFCRFKEDDTLAEGEPDVLLAQLTEAKRISRTDEAKKMALTYLTNTPVRAKGPAV